MQAGLKFPIDILLNLECRKHFLPTLMRLQQNKKKVKAKTVINITKSTFQKTN